MLLTIDQAPGDVPLVISEIGDELLARQLGRIGVQAGDILTRLEDGAAYGPVRVRSPQGEVVLGGGVAAKVIVHHDDGHKTPVIEMQPGESGHVEGLICGSELAEALGIMGIKENDSLRMLHRVPPMNYLTLVGRQRVQLTEGAATKIWGEMDGQAMQFAVTRRGKDFQIIRLLGGRRISTMLDGLGIRPGRTISLEAVTPALAPHHEDKGRIVVAMHSGLRLYLRVDQAQTIIVFSLGTDDSSG